MFKNLKSLFVLEEDSESSGKSKETPPKSSEPTKDEEPPKDASGYSGKINPRFTDILFQAMEQQNLPGFDYLEYKKSLQSLAKMPMDEATKYQSAYAMAQTMGVSVTDLLGTTQHYLDVLGKEEKKFQEALSKQEQTKIQGKENDLKSLQEKIKSKADQIKKLTAEIEEHQKEMASMKNEIHEAALRMQETQKDFMSSYQSLVDQIKADFEKMKTYLK